MFGIVEQHVDKDVWEVEHLSFFSFPSEIFVCFSCIFHYFKFILYENWYILHNKSWHFLSNTHAITMEIIYQRIIFDVGHKKEPNVAHANIANVESQAGQLFVYLLITLQETDWIWCGKARFKWVYLMCGHYQQENSMTIV